eukprot:Opistho-1_new@90757
MASLLRSCAVRAVSMRGLVAPSQSVVAVRFNSTAPSDKKCENPVFALVREKLGSTGVVTLTAGVLAFLISKEYIVFHHETVLIGTFSATVYGIYRAAGDAIGKGFDDRIEAIRKGLNQARVQQRASINEEINALQAVPSIDEFNKLQFDVYREMNTLTHEIARREAEASFYKDVKFKLDTLVKIRGESRRREQERIINLVTSALGGKLTAAQESAIFKDSLDKLQAMGKKK